MTTTQPGGTDRRSALVTPEAVQVDLPLADVGTRTLAILLDLLAMAVLLYVVLLLTVAAAGFVGDAAGLPGWVPLVIGLLLNFLVLWGYPTGFETVLRGRTPGKAALGLRVVTVDGAPVRFRHAGIRGLFAFVDFYLFLGIPALVTALVTRRGQRLGDLAAGTVTIRDRVRSTGADRPLRVDVPPGLEGYAQTLDVRALGAADYAVVRRFLLRAGELRPEHRQRIAVELATALAGRMRHTPPPGLHPEALLLCAAALLQRQSGNAAPARWGAPGGPSGAPGGGEARSPVPGPPPGVPSPPPGVPAPPPGPFAPPV